MCALPTAAMCGIFSKLLTEDSKLFRTKMATMSTAGITVNKIHEAVQASGLHFVIKRTPFSSYITIRQKFVENKETGKSINTSESTTLNPKVTEFLLSVSVNQEFRHQNLEDQNIFFQNENSRLRKQIKELESACRASNDTSILLNDKLSKAEASSIKLFKDKNEEINTFKTVINNHKKGSRQP